MITASQSDDFARHCLQENMRLLDFYMDQSRLCASLKHFLFSLQIKLVNINIPDIIDGKPSIILGLIWTIILQYHVSLIC